MKRDNLYYSLHPRLRNSIELCEAIAELIVYLFSSKEKRNFIDKVPRYCRLECPYVYQCRDKEKDWKCKKGCYVKNDIEFFLAPPDVQEYISKVPWYCREKCPYVAECRDKNNNYRCKNGCRVIKEKEQQQRKQ